MKPFIVMSSTNSFLLSNNSLFTKELGKSLFLKTSSGKLKENIEEEANVYGWDTKKLCYRVGSFNQMKVYVDYALKDNELFIYTENSKYKTSVDGLSEIHTQVFNFQEKFKQQDL